MPIIQPASASILRLYPMDCTSDHLSLCSTILFLTIYLTLYLSGLLYTLLPYSIVFYRNCIFMMLLLVHSRIRISLYIAFSLS